MVCLRVNSDGRLSVLLSLGFIDSIYSTACIASYRLSRFGFPLMGSLWLRCVVHGWSSVELFECVDGVDC